MPYLESLRVFLRVVDLGSITAGGRDLRLTPAVASKRIKELESHLGVRLFNRTTRRLSPTEVGREFYAHARKVISALDDAEAVAAGFSDNPRGTIRIAAPLGVGRRAIAPHIPDFTDRFPGIDIRLRLTDRRIDIFEDSIDLAFVLGDFPDSDLKLRLILDCPRALVASPGYLAQHGTPTRPDDLLNDRQNCLLLRYPRSPEYFWTLQTPDGPRKLDVEGRFDADDGDVLTNWALDGRGIANRPLFDVSAHLATGALVEVLPDTPPLPARFGCLFAHRTQQDPKMRLFLDFITDRARKTLT